MILIPKIVESVTCNVYKSRVAALMNEQKKKFFSIFSAKLKYNSFLNTAQKHTKDLSAKISDFGLAKLNEEENTHISTCVAGTT